MIIILKIKKQYYNNSKNKNNSNSDWSWKKLSKIKI